MCKMCCGAILLLSVLSLGAQAPSGWKHSTINDPLHAIVIERYELSGRYLTPPRAGDRGYSPLFTVDCVAGKVSQSYFSFDAVIAQEAGAVFPVTMEARLDGKATKIDGEFLSTDGEAVYFSQLDLIKLLNGNLLILGVPEYLGPQMVSQFNIADPSEVFRGCASDRILKHFRK